MPAPADLLTDPIESAERLTFLACVDAGSISQASVETGHPRASLTRRLNRLEERLGVRLLRRTTRSLAMTGAGEAARGAPGRRWRRCERHGPPCAPTAR